MGFSRQEYWSGLPGPPPGDLPDPGTEPLSPVSPALQADSLPLSYRRSPYKWKMVGAKYSIQLTNQGLSLLSKEMAD